MFFFSKKQKIDFDKLYQDFKKKYAEEISEDRQKELTSFIKDKGYIECAFADLDFKNSEIIYCLDEIIKCNFQKELYEIKTINLSALSGIMDWLKELVILPVGTAIYLTPFYKRDFECAYFIKDLTIDENIGTEEELKLFIYIAKLTGHHIICDFITSFARYAEPVIKNPYIAMWIDIKFAEEQNEKILDNVVSELKNEFEAEDLKIIKNIYKQDSKGLLSEKYNEIFKIFDVKVLEQKKKLSYEIYKKENQIKLQKRILGKTVQELMEEGLWTIPSGIDTQAGLPVFDYMNKDENYPLFKYFDKNGNDISHLVKDNFKTAAYFMDIQNNTINTKVLKFFTDLAFKYINEYGFDALKLNDLNCIFNENINDKIPVDFLKKINSEIKKQNVLLIADNNLDNLEKLQQLQFDIIWDKQPFTNPQALLKKNQDLANYNTEDLKSKNLLAVKIYNDKSITNKNTENESIFKWFCLHFLPGGRNAKLPILYLDGDESFTNNKFAKTLYQNIKLKHNQNNHFYNIFNAITQFSVNSQIIKEGEASIIEENEDGFISWIISKEPLKESFLIVANYKPEKETFIIQDGNEKYETYKENEILLNKKVIIPGEFKIEKEYVFNYEKFEEKDVYIQDNTLEIDYLKPCTFRIFLLRK